MSTTILISLISLIFLQYILMIDNLIFVSVLTERLDNIERNKARKIGLFASLIMNTLLILGAGYLSHIHTVLFQISTYKFTAHNLILLVGGVFLLYKTIKEIRSKFDKHAEETIEVPNILSKVVINMILIDILFSIDSTIIAIGMTNISWVQISSVLIAIVLMFFSFNYINKITDKFPSLKVLALTFLFLIGFSLATEGLGLEIPKGYIYAAMAFGLGAELLNIKVDRYERYLQLKNRKRN
jgi:predicted tellurium resistance membrane protein TerC